MDAAARFKHSADCAGKSVEKMLVEGELDALIHPELIQPILDKDKRVTRLFPNYREPGDGLL